LAPPRQAHLDGFNLHADVSAPAGNRARLEHFCRYLLPSPIAQERLALSPTRGAARDGRVLVTLRAELHDGTTHILFGPLDFLAIMVAPVLRVRSSCKAARLRRAGLQGLWRVGAVALRPRA